MNCLVLVKEKKKRIRTPSVSSALTTISTNEIEAIVDKKCIIQYGNYLIVSLFI